MTTIHLGDCQTDCETCTNNYHSGFNNIDCDVCGQFIQSAPLCNNCGQYENHANETDCPAYNFEAICQLCQKEITDNLGLDVAPWGATCAKCVEEIGIVITCDLCQTKTKNYSNSGFWNCLCETCWNNEKDRI